MCALICAVMGGLPHLTRDYQAVYLRGRLPIEVFHSVVLVEVFQRLFTDRSRSIARFTMRASGYESIAHVLEHRVPHSSVEIATLHPRTIWPPICAVMGDYAWRFVRLLAV